jgi:hypothetical protein
MGSRHSNARATHVAAMLAIAIAAAMVTLVARHGGTACERVPPAV